MFGGNKNKKRSNGGHFDTLIAEGTEINGNLTVAGGLHVDGKIEGQIKAAPDNQHAVVRLSEVGEVKGDIVAPHVIINGTVHGDVYSSEHIELAPKASITGNVYYNLIEMAMGAEVNGNLVHEKEAVPDISAPVIKAVRETKTVPEVKKESKKEAGDKHAPIDSKAQANS